MQRREFIGSGIGAVFAAGALAPARAAARRDDVVVVGAGLAGLAAALALEAAGLKVQVLEARQRVGGRLATIEAGGLRFDVGGVEVGASYGRIRSLAAAHGVVLDDPAAARPGPPGPPPPATINIGGVGMPGAAWPDSPLNPLEGRERALAPQALLSAALAADDSLPDPMRWLDPVHAALDVALATHLRARGWSAQAIRYMEVAANYSSLGEVSALDVLRRDGLRKRGEQRTLRVQGGSQRLPEAMAAALATPVRLGQAVAGIEQTRRGVEVLAADGSRHRARHVIVAVPAPVLARIAFAPELPAPLAEAARARPYTPVTTVHLAPLKPFWDDDGLPPTTWFDGPLERMFAVPGARGRIERLIVWLNGEGARRVDAFDDAALARWVPLELQRVRPASAGAVEVLATQSWGRDSLAGGAYAEIAAGRVAATAAHAARPHGRVHFAGEHTEFGESGMEAAAASGQRAARELLALA
jgi:monoamine oxidase